MPKSKDLPQKKHCHKKTKKLVKKTIVDEIMDDFENLPMNSNMKRFLEFCKKKEQEKRTK